MFPGDKEGEWEPHKVATKTVVHTVPPPEPVTNGVHAEPQQSDTQMTDAPPEASTAEQNEPSQEPASEASATVEEITSTTYQDDLLDVEGAVYPIQAGYITNFPCLFALLSHIYNMISPPFHSPILLISQPCWSARDHEILTQFFFEHFKIPAFCIIDAALTAIYAYGVPNATVVDVGYEKCDVTTVTDFVVNEFGRAVSLQGCGGRAMTKRLHQLLEKQGFNEDTAEQLKRSNICEILPADTALPQAGQNGEIANPAAAASTGALDSGANAKDVDGLRPGQVPRGPGMGTEVGEEGNGEEEDNEGILDVAAIVAKDNAAELLAKREQEKAAKAAARRVGSGEAAKPVRLKNSEKRRASFMYEEILPAEPTANGVTPPSRKRKREIEVGLERFMAATPPDGQDEGIVDIIASAIHSTVLTHPDASQRSALWDNLIILGQGSRVKGTSFEAALSLHTTDRK